MDLVLSVPGASPEEFRQVWRPQRKHLRALASPLRKPLTAPSLLRVGISTVRPKMVPTIRRRAPQVLGGKPMRQQWRPVVTAGRRAARPYRSAWSC